MKKKLRLHRETLRILDRSLKNAAGGTTFRTCDTMCFYISDVECPTDVGCGPDTQWMSACLECQI
jgi:hypothetical protein